MLYMMIWIELVAYNKEELIALERDQMSLKSGEKKMVQFNPTIGFERSVMDDDHDLVDSTLESGSPWSRMVVGRRTSADRDHT